MAKGKIFSKYPSCLKSLAHSRGSFKSASQRVTLSVSTSMTTGSPLGLQDPWEMCLSSMKLVTVVEKRVCVAMEERKQWEY